MERSRLSGHKRHTSNKLARRFHREQMGRHRLKSNKVQREHKNKSKRPASKHRKQPRIHSQPLESKCRKEQRPKGRQPDNKPYRMPSKIKVLSRRQISNNTRSWLHQSHQRMDKSPRWLRSVKRYKLNSEFKVMMCLKLTQAYNNLKMPRSNNNKINKPNKKV